MRATRETRSVLIPSPSAGDRASPRPLPVAYRAGAVLDRVLGIFAPRLAAQRMAARATLNQIEVFSNGMGGYDAGKINRLTKGKPSSRINENAIPLIQVQRLRWQANDLWRNNPHARKLMRTLEAKVVGRGLQPSPQATKENGKPHKKFRHAAKELWKQAARSLDYRGRASKGGQHFSVLQKLAFRSAVLSGDLLWHPKPLSRRQMTDRESVIPLALQLIHTERLAEYLTLASSEQMPDHRLFRGIEIDNEGIVAAYWILRHHPSDPMMFNSVQQADRFAAREIGHLYMPDDVDQFRGTTWFAPVLMQMRDTADYSYSELKAAALAACITLWYRRPTASNGSPFGVQMPQEWDLNDADGNPITAMQPGMMLDMGHDGELHVEAPQRGSQNAEAWINYMLRSTSCGMPGIKSSTITGDYRQSSFSSERSADNDAWPEIEGVQEWFGHGFCQPVYELVIDAGLLSGWFDGIVRPDEYQARRGDFLRCGWQGPIARSINPTDDAKSAKMRIENGTSTPQQEAAALNRDWHDNIKDVAEFIKRCRKLEIPEELIEQYLGFSTKRTVTQDDSGDAGGKKKDDDERAESGGVRSVMGPNGEDLSIAGSAWRASV